jgi:UDP-glucose 4-epimerase
MDEGHAGSRLPKSNRSMARILITGEAGWGSHCAKALAAVKHEAIVFGSLIFGHRDFVSWVKLIYGHIMCAHSPESPRLVSQFLASILHHMAGDMVARKHHN